MHSDLLELKNLGKTSVMWLNAIGVHKREQLIERGPVETYCAVKARGFKANRVLLYALQAALMDVHWKDLDPSLKSNLLAEAEKTSRG